MKKVIDGKLYNTATAKELGCDSYSAPGDFHYFEETLYRKKTGEFFLYGEGGPMSKYAESIGQNEWSGGEQIMPLSEESARKWSEEHLSADEYEEIFGEVSEDDPEYKVLSANLTIACYDKLKKMSADSGKSMSAILCELISKA